MRLARAWLQPLAQQQTRQARPPTQLVNRLLPPDAILPVQWDRQGGHSVTRRRRQFVLLQELVRHGRHGLHATHKARLRVRVLLSPEDLDLVLWVLQRFATPQSFDTSRNATTHSITLVLWAVKLGWRVCQDVIMQGMGKMFVAHCK